MTRTTPRRPGAIAMRHGRPAWENAPQRLRASQLERRFVPEIEATPATLLGRLLAKVKR